MASSFSHPDIPEESMPSVRVCLTVGDIRIGGPFRPSLTLGLERRRHRLQTGFSLIELMIALTIGLIVLLAVSVIFSQVSSGFRSNDDSSRASENGNFALRVIGEDLRMVGFTGLSNDPARIELVRTDMIDASPANNCGTTTWPFPNTNPGLEHIVDPGSLPCIPAGTYLPTSPAIVVRHATGMQTLPANVGASTNLFLQSSPDGGIIFMGTDYAEKVWGADRGLTVCGYIGGACTNPAAPIFQYVAYVYYIRPCSRPTGPGPSCLAADDEGQPIPTLVRRQLGGANPTSLSFVEVPIAEGVERLSVTYGLDANGDGTPEQYKAAPSAAELTQAITVRLSLLMRTRKPDYNHDDSPYTYTLANGTTYNCAADPAPSCKYRRYLYNTTVLLKNNAFRR